MPAALLFVIFVVLLVIAIPVSITLGIASVLPSVFDPSFTVGAKYLIRAMFGGLDSFPLLAVPMFVLSGIIMAKGGISKKLFDVFAFFLGNFTAGMPCAVIVTCLFYGAISGSAPATVAAVGSMTIPILSALGYDRTFSTAIVAVAGGLGRPALPGLLVRLGRLALTGLLVRLGRPALPGLRVRLGRLALTGLRALRVRLGRLALTGLRAQLALQELPALRVRLGRPALQELSALQELPAQRVLPVPPPSSPPLLPSQMQQVLKMSLNASMNFLPTCVPPDFWQPTMRKRLKFYEKECALTHSGVSRGRLRHVSASREYASSRSVCCFIERNFL